MNNLTKSLFSVLALSLFSLVSIQAINRFANSNPRVLGDKNEIAMVIECSSDRECSPNYFCISGACKPRPIESTPTAKPPQPISANGIPCDVVNNLQRTYCPNIPTPPQPTTSCKTDLTQFSPVTGSCKSDPTKYFIASYTCLDGYHAIITSSSPTSCDTYDALKAKAYSICLQHPYCGGPTPTYAYPTIPTYPTATPGITRTPPTPTSIGTSGFKQSILIKNTENYTSVNDSSSLTLYGNNSFTTEAFIKITDDPQMKDANPHYIIARQHNEGQSPGYALSLVNKKIEFEIYDLGSSKVYNVAGTTNLEPNRWYHVKGVLRYKDLFVFIDNKLDGSATAVIPAGAGPFIPTNKILTIGCMKGSDPSFSYCLGNFIGQIEEIRISKTARLPNSSGQPTVPFANDSSTSGLWHLDSNYLDSSSYNNNGYPSSNPPQFIESYLYPTVPTP